MGEVYQADDLKLGQRVALKFLPNSPAKDRRRLASFRNEVRLARQISHPNVCRVYDIAEVDGQPFLSMEYVDGEDLESLLRRIGRLPRDKGTDIARQLCAGLAAAHACGVIHRDLKPANVMLDGRGRVKITDFGLARSDEGEGQTAYAVGTPAYMAPEQLMRGETSFHSDVYSLGLLLFEIFVGKPLHEGASLAELRRRHGQSAPVPKPSRLSADIGPDVQSIVLKCLAKEPAERPDGANAVAAALPGMDPLAAMLAAGDTPSPRMVAAADVSNQVSTAWTIASFAAIVAGLALVLCLADRFTMFGQADPESPDFLLNKVHTVLNEFGVEDRTPVAAGFTRGRIAYGFEYDQGAIGHTLENDKSPGRWERLKEGHPPAVYFWYRQSPRQLIPGLFRGETGALGFKREMVSQNNPPAYEKGMLSLRLDTRGHLLEYHCDPRAIVASPAAAEQSWTAEDARETFQLAGLEYDQFEETGDAAGVSLGVADEFYRWKETQGSSARIVEAATFEGSLVFFNVIQPWDVTTNDDPSEESSSAYAVGLGFVAIFCVVLASATYVCYRNMRMGRGDQKTATLLASFVFLAGGVEWLFTASHAPSVAEFDLFVCGLSYWLFHAISAWVFYLAAEPYVRRYWPQSLTSWCRLFEGRFSDPLIGRDVLLGALGGVVSAVTVACLILAPSRFGFVPPLPFRNWDNETLTYVLAPRYAVGGVVAMLRHAVLHAVFSLLLLFVLRLLLRRPMLAAAAFVCVAVALRSGQVPLWYLPIIGLWSCIGVFLLTRYGMIACTSWLFVFFLLTIPMTSSGWYFEYGLAVVAVALGYSLYGLLTSQGGRPLIPDAKLTGRSTYAK